LSASIRERGAKLGSLVGLFVLALVGGCDEGPVKTKASSQAECVASKACSLHGQCTFRRSTGTCIVGSDADCARSNVCQKLNRCKKVGETCGAE
jgi:hypothetical protein